MEKKNNGIVILLVILVIGLSGYILYDKDVLGLKGEKGESNTSINDSSKKDENIEIGSVGNKESKIKLDIDDNLYFYIKDDKVVFHKQDGTEIVDSTIPDKVIQIAKGEGVGCNGNDSRLIALTEQGNVYYNKIETLTSISENSYDYKFDFIKVISDEKIYGVEAKSPKGFNSCSYTDLYAYVNKEDMKIVNVNRDTESLLKDTLEKKVVSVSLGKTYYELYPYVEEYYIFDLDGPVLLKEKDGKLYYNQNGGITNANMYLTIDNEYIYAENIYSKQSINDTKDEKIIIDKNKKVYVLTTLPTNKNYYKYTYTIKNTGKILKNIKEEKQEGKNNKITLEYTDGTSEEI